jgi:RsiW-degrading membrane proteinase PrsW (M82 family)
MRALLLLFVSILPVYLVGRYIYNKDRDKEPVGLITKLFFCGVGAFVLTIFITIFLGMFFPSLLSETYDTDLLSLFFRVFLGIALVEEFSKWLFVYKVSFNHIEFDQVYDMMVYAAFVALGFACVENIFYVFEHGFGVGIIRGLLAVPGHACDGVLMGYYLSMAKLCEVRDDKESKSNSIFMSILIPVLLHGFYDYCLFSQRLLFIGMFFIFVICLYIIVVKRIKKVSSLAQKIEYKYNFCMNCGRPVDGNYCSNCGFKNE